MKQDIITRNKLGNNTEIETLKSLAFRILERNKTRNNTETNTSNPVSLAETYETNERMLELFNERAAIAEYDGGLLRKDAELQAHKELQIRQ